MKTAKVEGKTLIDELLDDCPIEEIQYHLYGVEKIQRGIDRSKKEGTLSRDEVEKKVGRWTSK